MGNNASYELVQSVEQSLSSITRQITKGKLIEDSGGLDYKSKLSYIFWRKDVSGNIIIGVIDEKNIYMNFTYDFKENLQNSLQHTYQQQEFTQFKENLIQVQNAVKITYDITLNDFIKEYQKQYNPQRLIEQILQRDIIIENGSEDLDLNSNQGESNTNYLFCFHNYINQHQVIFVKSDKRDNISFDWKRNKGKKDSNQFIYKHSIQLKTPLKDLKEIMKKCSSYKSAEQFLMNEER